MNWLRRGWAGAGGCRHQGGMLQADERGTGRTERKPMACEKRNTKSATHESGDNQLKANSAIRGTAWKSVWEQPHQPHPSCAYPPVNKMKSRSLPNATHPSGQAGETNHLHRGSLSSPPSLSADAEERAGGLAMTVSRLPLPSKLAFSVAHQLRVKQSVELISMSLFFRHC